MNDIQRDRIKMLEFVQSTLAEHTATWTGNAAFEGLKTELDAAITGINTSFQAQVMAPNWSHKRAGRTRLEEAVWIIMNGLTSLAMITRDEVMLAEVDMSRTMLKRMPELELIGTAGQAINLAGEQSVALEPYGITPSALADVQLRADALAKMIGKPATERKKRSESTVALRVFLDSAVAVCKKLDRLVLTFAGASPEFVWAYKEGRKVIRQGHRKRALQARITDGAGKPVVGAMIRIPEMKVKRKTTAKGQVYVQHLKAGEHRMLVEAEGYVVKEVPVIIAANQRTVLEVALEKEERSS